MTRVNRFALVVLLALWPAAAWSGVNLSNFGIDTNVGGIGPGGIIDGGVIDGGGFGDPGGDPPPPPPDPRPSELEDQGYTCEPGGLDAIECSRFTFESLSETWTVQHWLCPANGGCRENRIRYGVPAGVDPADFALWAAEFLVTASNYWLGDFDTDGDADLAAEKNGVVHVAFSDGSFFDDFGAIGVPTPMENAGPARIADVNRDGIPDFLSVSEAGHLTVDIGSSSGTASRVELEGTYCEGLGDCFIADANGDGFLDLIEVMRGAVGGQRPGDVWVSLGYEVPGFPPVPEPSDAPDTDADGVPDREDNCTDVANASQLDGDSDGFGNACDADLNNDGVVDETDGDLFVDCLVDESLPHCAAADFNGDGQVNGTDFFDFLQPAVGQGPPSSAATFVPEIELFSPLDGAILPTGTDEIWVAGWVPNVPAGDVLVRVEGQAVPVTGPDNFFSTFVSLPDPNGPVLTFFSLEQPQLGPPHRMFHSVLVEADRPAGADVERRVALVGDRVEVGGRARGALGARISADGMAQVEDFIRSTLLPRVFEETPASIEGFHRDVNCYTTPYVPLPLPICWDGITVKNARMLGPLEIETGLEGNALHVNAKLRSFSFDWEAHMVGLPNCGEDVYINSLDIDLRYELDIVTGGRIQMREIQEPVISANIDVDGCLGAGHGTIESEVRKRLRQRFDDPDDRPETTGQTGPITGVVGGAVEDVFRNLDVSGTQAIFLEPTPSVLEELGVVLSHTPCLEVLDETFGAGAGGECTPPAPVPDFVIDYDARFQELAYNASGMSLWLEAGVEPVEVLDGLGGPDGAYQLPNASVPTIPNAMQAGGGYDLAATVTPNGLNEALHAASRAGLLEGIESEIRETEAFGFVLPLTAGVLGQKISAFASAFDSLELFFVRVGAPKLAPVVSGRLGPESEALDVHFAQIPIEFIQEATGESVLSVHLDARAGVDVSLAHEGAGELTAIAKKIELLEFALVVDEIGADLGQVAQHILCVGAARNPQGELDCATSDLLGDTVERVLGTVKLPSLRPEPEVGVEPDPSLELAPRCLERLDDGSLVAYFGLLQPGVDQGQGSVSPLVCQLGFDPTAGPAPTTGTVTTAPLDTGSGSSDPSPGGGDASLIFTTTTTFAAPEPAAPTQPSTIWNVMGVNLGAFLP